MRDKSQKSSDLDYGGKARSKYANQLAVGHNAFEFVLHFGQVLGDGTKLNLHTRIVMAPRMAKELLGLMSRSIGQYEKQFGQIVTEDSE